MRVELEWPPPGRLRRGLRIAGRFIVDALSIVFLAGVTLICSANVLRILAEERWPMRLGALAFAVLCGCIVGLVRLLLARNREIERLERQVERQRQ